MHKHGPGPLGHAYKQVEEHYHIVYHVPRENVSIPYFREIFSTPQDAYRKIAEIGKAAEPRTEWYEDGEIGFETSLPGRMGRYWVILELTGCVRRSCSQFMNREQRKRRFILLPDDAEAVPLET